MFEAKKTGNSNITVAAATPMKAPTVCAPQPKISRHLAYLKRAGLVGVRRDWKWSHYRIKKPANERAAKVFEEILEMLKADSEI